MWLSTRRVGVVAVMALLLAGSFLAAPAVTPQVNQEKQRKDAMPVFPVDGNGNLDVSHIPLRRTEGPTASRRKT